MFWCVDVLMCWCVDVLMCWCVDVLTCWRVDVLMCWCVDVMCWCIACVCIYVRLLVMLASSHEICCAATLSGYRAEGNPMMMHAEVVVTSVLVVVTLVITLKYVILLSSLIIHHTIFSSFSQFLVIQKRKVNLTNTQCWQICTDGLRKRLVWRNQFRCSPFAWTCNFS